jgi:pectate lyase
MVKYLIAAAAALMLYLCGWSYATVYATAADGWASMNGGTTGGEGGPVVTVTNYNDLLYYANTVGTVPYIIQISGTINIGADFTIRSNKTLRGKGANPTLIGIVGFQNRDGNIIIERLNITNPCTLSSCDGISLTQDIHNVLVTKCTIYDAGDGLFDISNNSDYVTVSWCKFYYNNPAPKEEHRFACLVGSSDTQSDDAANLRVTYHHNWWANRVKERMPRVRYGQVHVYNNYYSDLEAGGYCVGVGCGARVRVESNYFNTVPNPWANYYTGQTGCSSAGHIGWDTGNIFHNSTQPTWATNEYSTIFDPPYDYALDDTNDIPAMVMLGAGVTGIDFFPHWLFGPYGDYDRSGVIEMKDLAEFAGYWLYTDCSAIADADYDGDCNVNFYEFALFAANWLNQ